MLPTPEEMIRLLNLEPHPEGGAFAEVYRSAMLVQHPDANNANRAAMTAIYFLLRRGEFSAFHRVRSDESWHLYAGGPLELHLVSPDGAAERRVLGNNFAAGERPQTVVPAGWLQAARPAQNADDCLCGCVVAPGFDFLDFEMPGKKQLLKTFPQHADLIMQFTR